MSKSRNVTVLCAVLTTVIGGVWGTVAPAQLERRRLEVAHADQVALQAARDRGPSAEQARFVFLRPARSPAAAQGVELRMLDGRAFFLGPGTFIAIDVVPGRHMINARTLWGYVQSISFTLDHGTSQRFDREDPGLAGPCCPVGVVRELSTHHQRLAAMNWDAHRSLWDVPSHLVDDARTETLVAGYQNRKWPSRPLDMEITGEAGQTLFFRLDASRHGELTPRPLDDRQGERLVRRFALSAVRLQLTGFNIYEVAEDYPRSVAPDTTHGMMTNGLLDPLGPIVREGGR